MTDCLWDEDCEYKETRDCPCIDYEQTCCLCGGPLDDAYGHNPWPLADEGVCCNACNIKVINARLLLK